ncbi:DNA-binding protein P3A2-like isoform X6 [Scylla paramamosain]|uniref:DNA-binding protein P3A2-like isoform X6 n=1 Tax=Scylla paramamosain TaxID=85552 RepID=UPI0030833889
MSGSDSGSSYLVMNSVDASSLRGWRVALAGGQELVMNSVEAAGLTSVTSETTVEPLDDTGGGGGVGDSVGTQITSDDDDDDVPSSPGSFGEDEGSMPIADDVTAQLAAAGPVGVAAAAAITSAKKRKRHHCFELNPSIRKRQKTRLLRKLKATIDEYSTRVGQQAVVVVATPSKSGGNDFKCFGAKPLEDVMKTLRQMLMTELENALAQQAPPPPQDDPSLHELPPLIIDGIPTPVEKMTQAQLRAFIPLMLKYSTGRGKPGWGKESTRPPWWPKDVPWANVRMDARSEDQKHKVSWTTALRQIVINCYKFHGRDDLLPVFTEEDDKSQVGEQIISQTNSVYSGQVVQTISNPDGTVSIVQVDPSNPVIQLPDGTTAHVQGIATIATQNGESLDGESGGSAGSVAIDLNPVSEGTLAHEGTILLTGEDGSQIPVNVSGSYPVSGMITVPLPVYQTVVANIQGQDGQPLQVVTPLVQVPKLEPGLEGGVEVSAGLNASLNASTIISSGQAQVQPLKIVKPRTLSSVSFKEDDDDDGSVDMVDKE